MFTIPNFFRNVKNNNEAKLKRSRYKKKKLLSRKKACPGTKNLENLYKTIYTYVSKTECFKDLTDGETKRSEYIKRERL